MSSPVTSLVNTAPAMDSIRGCTKICFVAFDRWLDKLPSEPAIKAQNKSDAGHTLQDASISKLGTQLLPKSNQLGAVPATIRSVAEVEDRVAVENLLFRFRIWAEHNSALSERHDSLDWRLRKSSMTHSVMIDLLTDLSHAILSMLPSLPERSTLITIAAVRIEVADASAEAVQTDVQTMLNQLFCFSRTIRRSGCLRRVAKATDYIDYDELGNDLNAKFRDSTQRYLEIVVGDKSDYLRARLLETICMRQQSFAFQRSRRADSVTPPIEAPNKDAQHDLGTLPSSKVTNSGGPKQLQSRSSTTTSSLVRRSSLAPSSATTFVSKSVSFGEKREQTPNITFLPEDLPRIPKVSDDRHKKEQECPYCFVMCPVEEFTGSAWSLHIIEDLMPFICTLETCSRPNVLYDTTTAWLNHMRLDHARHGWTCLDLTHDEPLCFSAKEMFSNHITQDHGDILSTEELDAIAEDCYGILEDDMPFDHCPFFCGEDTTQHSCDALTSHVAKHLLLLSQVSLVGHDLIEGIDPVSSTDTASQPQAPGSQQGNSRKRSIGRTMSSDDAKIILDNDGSATSDHDPETPADHPSDVALPIPWSTELETWTEAGNWDEICNKIETLGGYNEGADKVLQSFIRSYPEKTSYKDTNDSYSGATRESPIAEQSKSPQQPILSVAQEEEPSQPIQWSEEYQRYYQSKFNFTTLAWDTDWNVSPDSRVESAQSGGIRARARQVDSNLHYEALDSSFQVRNDKFFIEGKVIAVLWNETASATTKSIDYNTPLTLNEVRYQGNIVHTNLRRFVVVKRKRDFCFACPILTYNGRGCTKNGVVASEHAIAYTWNDTPRFVQGEAGFTKPGVPVVMADDVSNLHFASRINFGIEYPIQYNIKVKDIGYVRADHVPTLISSWQEEHY